MENINLKYLFRLGHQVEVLDQVGQQRGLAPVIGTHKLQGRENSSILGHLIRLRVEQVSGCAVVSTRKELVQPHDKRVGEGERRQHYFLPR